MKEGEEEKHRMGMKEGKMEGEGKQMIVKWIERGLRGERGRERHKR